MTHPITVPSKKQQSEIKSLKLLPAEDQSIIVEMINQLFSEKPLPKGATPESVEADLITKTDYPDSFCLLGCRIAQY